MTMMSPRTRGTSVSAAAALMLSSLLVATLALVPVSRAAAAETHLETAVDATAEVDIPGFDVAAFANPTTQKPTALWFRDRLQTNAQIDIKLETLHTAGFTGVTVFRWASTGAEPYFSQAWLDRVQHLLEKSKELGMTVWLSDDDQFPSGAAGGYVARGGSVGDKTYAPRPELASKAIAPGSLVRATGDRTVDLKDMFTAALRADAGSIIADARTHRGATLLKSGASWTDYSVTAEFTVDRANAGFMVRSSDPLNGYLIDGRNDVGGVDVYRQVNGRFAAIRVGNTPGRGGRRPPSTS
ncbi:hypothetical protein ACIQLJ_01745 [Microbacterium sp. NPDC091313]